MKKFKYYGREVEVPDYATHIAVDSDGECWWYTTRPTNKWQYGDSCWKNVGGIGSNCGRVGYFDNVDNWKGSLRSC